MPTKSNNTGGRGGARPGAGRKKSAVKDKAENGNPGGRKLEVLDIPEVEGVAMPKPHDFLSAEQRDGRHRKFTRKPGSGLKASAAPQRCHRSSWSAMPCVPPAGCSARK